MSPRSGSIAARNEREAFASEQRAKQHRAILRGLAGDLKARARAANVAGTGSVTVNLPAGEARLVAAALEEWASDREAIAAANARTARILEMADDMAAGIAARGDL